MSQVTNAILVMEIISGDSELENQGSGPKYDLLTSVNNYFHDNYGFVSAEQGRNDSGSVWYGGSKHLECEMWVGAFNHLDIEALIEHLKKIDWEDAEVGYVQLFFKREDDNRFLLIDII